MCHGKEDMANAPAVGSSKVHALHNSSVTSESCSAIVQGVVYADLDFQAKKTANPKPPTPAVPQQSNQEESVTYSAIDLHTKPGTPPSQVAS